MKILRDYIWIVIIVCVIIVMLYYYFNQFRELSTNPSDWGAFGSYMGAITGLLAFAGVLFSVRSANRKAEAAEKKAEQVRKEAQEDSERLRAEAKAEAEKQRMEAEKKDERDLFFKLMESHQKTMEGLVAKNIFNEEMITGTLAFDTYVMQIDNDTHTLLLLLPIGEYKTYGDWVEGTNMIKHDRNVFIDLRNSFMDAAYATRLDDDPNYKISDLKLYFYIRGCLALAFQENNLRPIYKYVKREETPSYRQYPKLFYQTKNELEKYTIFKIVARCLYKSCGSLLSYHFNNISYITKMLDSFKYDKDFYMDYWKSKLSSNECIIFFFYLLSDKVDIGIIDLVLKYNLLENMVFSDMFLLEKGESLKKLAIDSLKKFKANTKEAILVNIENPVSTI